MTQLQKVRAALALAAIATTAVACRAPSTDVSAVAESETPALSRVGQSAPQSAPTAVTVAPPLAAPDDLADAPDTEPPASLKSSSRRSTRARTASPATTDGTASDPGGGVELKRLVVGTRIEGREPVGVAKRFRADDLDRLYVYVDVNNPARLESSIFVTLSPPSGAATPVELRVGAEPRWRTWSLTRRPKVPGTWTAVVRDGEGRVLGRTTFEVVP